MRAGWATGANVIYVPKAVGHAAMEELGAVTWEALSHAYGRGPQGPTLDMDVEAALRAMAGDDETYDDAFHGLFSNICHQGTIYEATPHAIPFLAALAAGDDCPLERVVTIGYLLAAIGASACYVAPRPSHAGSVTEEVATTTRASFAACRARLEAMAKRKPAFTNLANVLAALAQTTCDRALSERITKLAADLDRVRAREISR